MRVGSIALANIPAGEFWMGSEHSPEETAKLFGGGADWYPHEHPRHRVTLTKPFLIGITHVTRGQFAEFVNTTGYKTTAETAGFAQHWTGKKFDKVDGANWRNTGFDQTDDHPAVCISWDDANAFCKWLSERTNRTVRLPTEAEWEYARRANQDGAYLWGNDPAQGQGWANCADADWRAKYPESLTFDWSDGFIFTSPAGHFRASAWGLHDMSGNAWQWCSDWYAPYTDAPQTNPTGAAEGTARVIRGGAWFGAPTTARAAFRNKIKPTYHGTNIGFRVVVEQP